MSTAYHPQTNGQTERVNQSLEQYLRCYVDYNLTNWSELLPTAEFAYNNQSHESIKNSPFYVELGYHPRAGPEVYERTQHKNLDDIMRARLEAQEKAKSSLALAAERMKWYYDKGVQAVKFKVGDKVLLSLRDYQRTERALQPRYEGPFEIVEKLSEVTFKVNLPSKFRAIHPVFHASKLMPYTESTIPGQAAPKPSPILVKGEQEWEVEEILQHKKTRGKFYYLIRWKGYTRDHDTWEPASNITNAKDILKKYKQKHKIHFMETLDQEVELLFDKDEDLEMILRRDLAWE
jgi:hypothetical protein